jgi:hypothetical protein
VTNTVEPLIDSGVKIVTLTPPATEPRVFVSTDSTRKGDQEDYSVNASLPISHLRRTRVCN